MTKKKMEYLVSSPKLPGPFTIREPRPEHKIISARRAPVCPRCGNDDSFVLTWDGKKGYCPLCEYRIGDKKIVQ